MDKLIRIFVGVFIGIWVARYLGPEDFGLLNFVIAYCSFFSVFVSLGLEQILVREIVKKPRLKAYLLGTGFYLKLIGACLSLFILCCSLLVTNFENDVKVAALIIGLSFLFQSFDVIDYYYQARIKAKYIVFARTSSFIVCNVLKVAFILNDFSVFAFLWVFTLEVIISAALLLSSFIILGENFKFWQINLKIAKKLLGYSWPLALSLFLISIHMKIDQVMIGSLMDNESVGVYSVAVKLTEFWLFIPSVMISALMPYFVRLRETDNQRYEARLMQLYSLMFWMGVAIGLLFTAFGQAFITTLFGSEYEGAYQPLIICVWSGIFISQALARGMWLINEDLQVYRLYSNAIIVLFNIILNFWLIPRLGIMGAAVSTLLTQVIGTWCLSFMWKPLRSSTFSMIKSINPIYLFIK